MASEDVRNSPEASISHYITGEHTLWLIQIIKGKGITLKLFLWEMFEAYYSMVIKSVGNKLCSVYQYLYITYPNNLLATLAAAGGQVGSITVLAVQLA